MKTFQSCNRCILDTTVPGIKFDDQGICSYCKLHDKLEAKYPLTQEGQEDLYKLIETIKKSGLKNKYDCIVGLSGGRDSSYLVYWAKSVGLKPLAVFYDSGWYSEQSKHNIRKVVEKLNIDLITVACDQNEYRDIQISFLKASTNDIDAPDDQAIITVLYRVAAKHNVKYILSGHVFRTEGNTPIGWSYMDGRYVRDVHNKYGTIKIKSYPIMHMHELVNYVFIKRIKYIYPLEYIDYKRDLISELLRKEFDWIYSGGHHFDCQYIHLITRILREKFMIDKRKVEYSAMIRTNQITRNEGLSKIENNPSPEDNNLVKYSLDRLGLNHKDYLAIFNNPPKTFMQYKTYFDFIRIFRFPIKIACKLNILPMTLYEKYVVLSKDLVNHYQKNENSN